MCNRMLQNLATLEKYSRFMVVLKDQDFALGEWYSCRGLAVVANSGVSLWGLRKRTANT